MLRSQHAKVVLVNKRLTEQVAEICAVPMSACRFYVWCLVVAGPCISSVQPPANNNPLFFYRFTGVTAVVG